MSVCVRERERDICFTLRCFPTAILKANTNQQTVIHNSLLFKKVTILVHLAEVTT